MIVWAYIELKKSFFLQTYYHLYIDYFFYFEYNIIIKTRIIYILSYNNDKYI